MVATCSESGDIIDGDCNIAIDRGDQLAISEELVLGCTWTCDGQTPLDDHLILTIIGKSLQRLGAGLSVDQCCARPENHKTEGMDGP